MSFSDDIRYFMDHITSLESTLPSLMVFSSSTVKQAEEKFNNYIKEGHATIVADDSESTTYRIESENLYQFQRLKRKLHNVEIAYKTIPRGFIVSLVSQYDAFLGRLIRTMFNVKPEKLNSSEKNMQFSEIIKFNSIEDIKEAIIEKEVETVLRKSHSEQFDWLENKLSIKLREGLEIWTCFIELTERRNLFVHCDGVISSQYLRVCRENGVMNDSEDTQSFQLNVSPKYFRKSVDCIFEIGVKLAHVMWRKLQDEDREAADSNLIEICFDLIYRGKYKLAITLLDFATDVIKKYASEENRLTFIINKAQAYKWDGDNNKCKQILNKVDWSAYQDIYQIANAVLLDDFKSASLIMKKLAKNESINKNIYIEWPLFKEFRKSQFFIDTYKELFGEEFGTVNETIEKDNRNDIAFDEAASNKEKTDE